MGPADQLAQAVMDAMILIPIMLAVLILGGLFVWMFNNESD